MDALEPLARPISVYAVTRYKQRSAADSTARYIEKVAIFLGPNTPHHRTLYRGKFPVIGAFILASHTPATHQHMA